MASLVSGMLKRRNWNGNRGMGTKVTQPGVMAGTIIEF